jgi:hypothetical protein
MSATKPTPDADQILAFTLKPIPADAIDFLRGWEPNGPWSLMAVKPDTKPPEIETRTFTRQAG